MWTNIIIKQSKKKTIQPRNFKKLQPKQSFHKKAIKPAIHKANKSVYFGQEVKALRKLFPFKFSFAGTCSFSIFGTFIWDDPQQFNVYPTNSKSCRQWRKHQRNKFEINIEYDLKCEDHIQELIS